MHPPSMEAEASASRHVMVPKPSHSAWPAPALAVTRPGMLYVYSTPNGAGRAMSYEELPNPWPMLLVAVFDDDQEEEAARLLYWLGGQPTVA